MEGFQHGIFSHNVRGYSHKNITVQRCADHRHSHVGQSGTTVLALCRQHPRRLATLYKWRSKYGEKAAALMSQLHNATMKTGVSTSATRKHNCVRTCSKRPSQKSGQAQLSPHDGSDGTPAGQNTSSPRLSQHRCRPQLSLPAHLWSGPSCQCQLAERFDANVARLLLWLESQVSLSNLSEIRACYEPV